MHELPHQACANVYVTPLNSPGDGISCLAEGRVVAMYFEAPGANARQLRVYLGGYSQITAMVKTAYCNAAPLWCRK